MSRRACGHGLRLLIATWLAGCGSAMRAAEPKVPEPTGVDFLIQGEYAGQVFTQAGETPVGVQVAATGKGKFSAVGYIGGLPGDGWDRSPLHGSKGEIKDGMAEFKSDEYSSTVKNGLLSISVAQVKISELKKENRQSPSLGEKPPAGAVVLFDGSSAENFESGKIDEEGLLLAGCASKEKFGSGLVHVEFRVPYLPDAQGQERGGSGVVIQGRWEIQILDSFGDEASDKGCGAIFGIKPPDQNLCYPPFAWQTFDIEFSEPKYEDGKKVEGSEATVTVRQNGRPIHRRTKLLQTTAGAPVAAGPGPGPIVLEDKTSAVRFRNIWFKPVTQAEEKK
jgi:Domain of Unknown Function (DUF1080)